jgi:hypothetical protein
MIMVKRSDNEFTLNLLNRVTYKAANDCGQL